VAFCAVLISCISPGVVKAECGKQGAFALALAQLLGHEVTGQDAAIEILTNVGVEPIGGWQPDACVTEEVAHEIDKGLKNAVAMGIFKPEEVAGIVALALESIGEGDIVLRMSTIPYTYLERGSRVGGPPLEGNRVIPPPPPPPLTPPITTTTRPPASPFIP